MQKTSTNNRKLNLIGALFLAIGILFVMIGVHRTEHVTVGQKSNIICLECIGIG